jgi:hypothetical protein
VTLALADSAARLRAKYGLRTPDALHLATAITGSATGFIGNDHAFQRVTELEILLIDAVAPIPVPIRNSVLLLAIGLTARFYNVPEYACPASTDLVALRATLLRRV